MTTDTRPALPEHALRPRGVRPTDDDAPFIVAAVEKIREWNPDKLDLYAEDTRILRTDGGAWVIGLAAFITDEEAEAALRETSYSVLRRVTDRPGFTLNPIAGHAFHAGRSATVIVDAPDDDTIRVGIHGHDAGDDPLTMNEYGRDAWRGLDIVLDNVERDANSLAFAIAGALRDRGITPSKYDADRGIQPELWQDVLEDVGLSLDKLKDRVGVKEGDDPQPAFDVLNRAAEIATIDPYAGGDER